MKKFRKTKRMIQLFCLLLFIPIPACSESVTSVGLDRPDENIRPPAVAGGFYPAYPSRLKEMIVGFLDKVDSGSPEGKIIALIVPHAGYVYSGQTAAFAFKLLQGSGVKTVFLIGSSHKSHFPGVSIYADDGYRTPLGVVPVDKTLAAWFHSQSGSMNYYPQAHSREHSLEVELPFLQEILGEFKVVPILIGQTDNQVIEKLGKLLAEALEKTPDSVIVCSTDLTHYPPYRDAVRIDRETLEAIKSMDRKRVVEVRKKYIPGPVPNLACAMCGEQAVLATMEAAELAGADNVEILDYSNSGDASFGDKNRVVGYGAVAFIKTNDSKDIIKEKEMSEESKEQEGMSESSRKRLLAIARAALTDAVNGRPLPDEPVDDPELQGHQGAFVTLTERGQLRGCIGQFTADRPLYQVVRGMAMAAALRDTRFRRVQPAELDDISIEISVLSPMRRITDPMNEVELGKHGIYIKRGWQTGTYLPQVATEHRMSKEEFLSSCTSHKAGLPPDSWKDPDTEVYVYTAEVFNEVPKVP